MLAQVLMAILHFKIGLATTFSNNDRFNPDINLACLHRNLRNSDHVIAHPRLTCGQKVILWNLRTMKYTIAKVADRGPRHAMVDLTPHVAKAIGSNGYEQVLMVPLGVKQ